MGEFAKKISLCDSDTPLAFGKIFLWINLVAPLLRYIEDIISSLYILGDQSVRGLARKGTFWTMGVPLASHTVFGRMTLPGPPCFVQSRGDTILTTLFSTVPIVAWGGQSLIPFSSRSRRYNLLSCGIRESINTKKLNIIPFLFSYGFRTPYLFKLRVSETHHTIYHKSEDHSLKDTDST